MSGIRGINGSGHLRGITPPLAANSTNRTAPSAPGLSDGDEVEISQTAQFLSRAASLPEIRYDKVSQIRSELAQNTYDVEGKLSEALDRLLDEHA